jgi:AtzE family amidohydrolase
MTPSPPPLWDLTAADIAAEVRAGRRSAVRTAKEALAQIVARDAGLNCFTSTLRDRALESAQAVDDAIRQGRDPGPLAGVPFAAKNLFDIEGVVTLAGSVIEASKPAASADSVMVARMEAAGAVLVGALNMDEYAYGFTTENSHYGPTRNPHDPTRISGGSSGGSAAAVGAGLVPLSLGSDTNGSIRVPAALCGVCGLKPTFGRLSRRGSTPFVHSLDHVGPFARTVKDLALIYDALQGHDPDDPVSADRPIEAVSLQLDGKLPSLRVGLLGGFFKDNASLDAIAATELVASRLQARWAELPGAKAARAAAFCLTGAEGGSLHLADLRARPGDFDPSTRDRLIAGAMQPAHVLAKAQRVRRWFLDQALELFERFDILLAPATPFSATSIGQATTTFGGDKVSVRAYLGAYTQPISFIGLPVLAAPVNRKGAMPLGVQMIAAPWREAILMRAAAWLEAEGVIGARKPSTLVTAPTPEDVAAHGH